MTRRPPAYQRLFAELKRRRVFRVMAVYGIVGFVVLQVMDLAVPALLLPEWTYRLVTLLFMAGFPVTVVLAWVFDVTPQGVRRTDEAEPGELDEILQEPRLRRWPSGVAALLAVAAMIVGAWYVGRRSAHAAAPGGAKGRPPAASIAVLPFVNESADPNQEYFSDGISEELLNLLAQVPGLRVSSRTSAFSFKGQSLEISEIARKLGVTDVLEGSVRKEGSEVRISVQLVDATADTLLWAESWDRTLGDVFAVQDEIAGQVAHRLKLTLLGAAPHAEETDSRTYSLFLQARELRLKNSAQAYDSAVALLQRALAIDSTYAPAWGLLGVVYTNQTAFGMRPRESGVALAQDATERALELDPDLARAQANAGYVSLAFDDDPAAAAQHLERALRLAPSDARVLGTAATLAENLGDAATGIALEEHAVRLDPVNPTEHANLGVLYLNAGRWDEAIAQLRSALRIAPDYLGAHHLVALGLLKKGEPETALAENEQEPDEGWRMLGRVVADYDLGRTAASDSALAELIRTHERDMPYNIAGAYAWRGEPDRAFEWLDKAVEYGDSGLSEIVSNDLWFGSLHDDPRWLPFLRRIGKAPEQLAEVHFDFKLPK